VGWGSSSIGFSKIWLQVRDESRKFSDPYYIFGDMLEAVV